MSEEPLTRLLQEQKKATTQTQLTIDQLSTYKLDYECLISQLDDLQKSVSQPALIPFGRKALVHGRLIHTNEILVHLGGGGGGCEHEYFAKLSTHESIDLIRRRIERIDNQIQLLQKQKNLIEDRIAYTSQLADKTPRIITNQTDYGGDGHKASDEEVEIREYYDSDAENHRRQEHRKRFQREEALDTSVKPYKKKVSFDLSNIKHELPNSSESSDASYESGNSDELTTIHFTHSSITQSTAVSAATKSGELCHLSPSEVVDMVIRHGFVQGALCCDALVQARSPLTANPPSVIETLLPDQQIQTDDDSQSGNPFTGAICEHKNEANPTTVPSDQPITRVSRFRASRLNAKVK